MFHNLSRYGSLLSLLLVLAACTGYERLAQQPIDQTYTVNVINWTNSDSTLVFLRAFEEDGQLAICGAYTGKSDSTFNSQANRQLFDTANIFIGDERIGPMSFMQPIPMDIMLTLQTRLAATVGNSKLLKSKSLANCVRTKNSWRDAYSSEEISWQGPHRIVVFD
jgi:hypothetical protein